MRNRIITLIACIFAIGGTLALAQNWWGQWPPDRVSAIVEQVHADLTAGYHSGWKFTSGGPRPAE